MIRSAKQVLLGLLATLVFSLSLSAQAVTLLSNTANPTDGSFVGTPDSADHFTTGTEPLTVTSVRVLWESLGGIPGVNQVGIYTDAAGAPSGTLVGSFFTNPAVTTTGIVEYTGNVALAANTTYWMVVDITDGSDVAYTFTDTFVADPSTGGAQILDRSAFGDNVAVSWNDDPANLQFEIVGVAGTTVPATAIPTLSVWSLLLLAAALVAFGMVVVKRRSAQQN